MNHKRAYYGVLPTEVRDNRILPAQVKLLYAELSSRTDANNACSIETEELAGLYDVDAESINRWIALLISEKHILGQNVMEKKSCWKISLLFPLRPSVQEKENNQTDVSATVVKTESKSVALPSTELKKETKQIELTPEQILLKHFSISEMQARFPYLEIEKFELPNWSSKILLRYGKANVLKEKTELLSHFYRWCERSKHTNLKGDVSDI